MLAAYPDVFAAGGIIGGLPFGAAAGVSEALFVMRYGRSRTAAAWGDRVRRATDWKGPWPRVSIWTGSADPVVVPANAGELVKQWTDVHGIRSDPVTERVAGFSRRAFRDAAGRPMVELYEITGMGHGVPIDPGPGPEQTGMAGPFNLSVGISSTVRIARFFGLDLVRPAGSAETAVIVPMPEIARDPVIRQPEIQRPEIQRPVAPEPAAPNPEKSGLLARLRRVAGALLDRLRGKRRT
jgi:feruloyl esterase